MVVVPSEMHLLVVSTLLYVTRYTSSAFSCSYIPSKPSASIRKPFVSSENSLGQSRPSLASKVKLQARDEFEKEDDEYDYASVGRGRRRYREPYDEPKERDYYNDEEYDLEDDVEIDYKTVLFGEVIPNPILDALDPERSTERVGELFADKKFWRDMAFLAVVLAIWQFTIPTPWISQLRYL